MADQEVQSWSGPLKGIKVLDLSRVMSGPFAAQMLGDLGAEVIKIEPPEGGDDTRQFPPLRDGISHFFLSVNRNKKSMVLNLKDPRGADLLRELARDADILIENFRPGVMERLGIGYEALAKINPRIIYCAITGFGLSGPLRDRPSFDIVIQALSGALSINGEHGKPAKLGIPLGDLVGGIYGPIGILAALHERNTTGVGQLLDVSLLDGMIGMLGYYAQLSFFLGTDPQPQGSHHPNLAPYGIYPASDGSIVIACLTDIFWQRLCRALELSEALADPRFGKVVGRRDHRIDINALVADRTRRYTVVQLEALFLEYEVPYAPVLGVKAALDQPQSKAREMVVETEHNVLGSIPIVGRSIKFVGKHQGQIVSPPALGQHTDEILSARLGISAAAIAELRKSGVVG